MKQKIKIALCKKGLGTSKKILESLHLAEFKSYKGSVRIQEAYKAKKLLKFVFVRVRIDSKLVSDYAEA